MKPAFLIALAVAGLLPTGAAAAAQEIPAAAAGDAFFAAASWDDDDDDFRRYGPMPLPDRAVLRRAGMVRAVSVERDDGHLEIEGRDARGREIDIRMDLRGKRILRVERDRHDDRWDD